MDIEKMLGIKLPWYQNLYIEIISKNLFINTRRNSKTGVSFMLLLEGLKQSARTEEEKLFYQQVQEEWSQFNIDLTLSYWK